MEHKLKIEDRYLKAKLNGDKLFEIRNNDRGFQKGDIVLYMEYTMDKPKYHYFEITYVTGFMQQQNYVVFGEKYLKSE